MSLMNLMMKASIYKSNIHDCYSLRPKRIPSVDELCLAKLAAFYYKDYITSDADTKDSQPDILNDELLELKHSIGDIEETCLPCKIKLMGKSENMKCRKVKAVIRYHTPNKRKEPDYTFITSSCCTYHGETKQSC